MTRTPGRACTARTAAARTEFERSHDGDQYNYCYILFFQPLFWYIVSIMKNIRFLGSYSQHVVSELSGS